MAEVFVVRNQLGHYWGKGKLWVDGREARAVMRARHEDEAINTLFELGSKDFELRGEVIPVELTERGDPVVEASDNLIEIEIAEEIAEELVEESVEESAEESAEESTEQPAETIAEENTPANAAQSESELKDKTESNVTS